jgi:hypothetical protein
MFQDKLMLDEVCQICGIEECIKKKPVTDYSYLNKLHQNIVSTLDYMSTVHLLHELPPCIIYDIDDTLLDKNGSPIVPILNTYFYAIKKDYRIIIITARENNKNVVTATIEQLNKIGVTKYDDIFFRPPTLRNLRTYKENTRTSLTQKYFIIASIGDAPWDVEGKHTGYGFHVKHE